MDIYYVGQVEIWRETEKAVEVCYNTSSTDRPDSRKFIWIPKSCAKIQPEVNGQKAHLTGIARWFISRNRLWNAIKFLQ